jgi:hypothetical protein
MPIAHLDGDPESDSDSEFCVRVSRQETVYEDATPLILEIWVGISGK